MLKSRAVAIAVAEPLFRGLSTIPDDLRSAFGYCVGQVKAHDNENFQWCAQLPKEIRAPVFAIRAFNVETVMIGDAVRSKETPLLQLRFQWWREMLATAFQGKPADHPLLKALAHLHSIRPMNRYNFRRILDAREEDLLDPQPPLSMDGLEKYAESTASQLLYLCLQATGVSSRDADHAASHVGKAVGLATLLRGTPFHAQERRSYLPLDLCIEHGVSQEDIYRGTVTEGLRDVVLAVASVAKGHLDHARELQPKMPREARLLMMAALGSSNFLQALEKADFDPYNPSLQAPRGLRDVLSLKYHMLTAKF